MLTPVFVSIGMALLAATQAGAATAPPAPPAATAAQANPAAAGRLVREGQEFYRQGKLGEALLKFEEAIKAGAEGGELFYQTGYCYKTARQDTERGREYMTKAVPLLEKMTAEPAPKSPAPYYYLSAIYSLELGDSAKGVETAKRGIALVEKGAFKSSTDGETYFQIGRLYSLTGETDKAAGWYEKAVAALDTGKVTNRQYLVSSVDQLAKAYMKNGNYEKGALWLQRLVDLEPQREQEKLTAGLAMIRVGRYKEAMQILRGFTNDDLASEANIIVKVLTRYLDLGSPAIAPSASKLDDAGLLAAQKKSAATLAALREKEDAAAKSGPQPELPWTWVQTRKGKQKVRQGRVYPPPGWQPKDPDHPTPEELDYMAGVVLAPKKPVVPPSAERVAAEKEFFSLIMEELRRGRVIRETAVINGFQSLIFR